MISSILLTVPTLIFARNNNNQVDYSMYGMSMQRDWMSASSKISIKNLGCVWGYVDSDNGENMGCMPNDSGDGTTSWYQMANCKRAQVAYGMYSSNSCNNRNFQESFVTKSGVAEFAYLLGSYGYNPPISGSDTNSFPMCEGDGNGYYLAVGCSSSGGFTVDRFTDQYCLEYYDTYDTLSSFNSVMKKLSCYTVHDSSQGQDVSYSLASYLIADSGSCSASESSLCTTSSFVSNAGSGGYQRSRGFGAGSSGSFGNKLKYTLGSAMLVGSLVMFFGILFTNRRKRHALLNRKFRNSSDKKKKSRKKSSSSKNSKKASSSKKASAGVFA